MDEGKLENGIYQSISHWGLIDASIREGLITINCDSDGMPVGHEFEPIDEVLPLLVVNYDNRGQLVIMGDHNTGLISERRWYPEQEGAMPPRDEFTQGMDFGAPSNATRH